MWPPAAASGRRRRHRRTSARTAARGRAFRGCEEPFCLFSFSSSRRHRVLLQLRTVHFIRYFFLKGLKKEHRRSEVREVKADEKERVSISFESPTFEGMIARTGL